MGARNRALIVAAALAFAALGAACAARAEERCSCKHQSAIEDRLKQAEAARDIYQRKASELERAERDANFDPERIQQLRDGYKSWRDNDFKSEFARRAGHETGRASATASEVETVEFDWGSCTSNQSQLFAAMAKEACRELAEILQHHEAYHEDVCTAAKARRAREAPPRRQTSASIERAVNGLASNMPSGDPWDEVGAYSLEIAELNALLDRIANTYGVDYKVRYESTLPTGAIRWTIDGFVPLEVAKGPYPRKVTGHADAVLKGSLQGGCPGSAQPSRIPLDVTGSMTARDVWLTFENKTITRWELRCPNMAPLPIEYAMVPKLNNMRFDNKLGAKAAVQGPGATPGLPTGASARGGWELTLTKKCKRPS